VHFIWKKNFTGKNQHSGLLFGGFFAYTELAASWSPIERHNHSATKLLWN